MSYKTIFISDIHLFHTNSDITKLYKFIVDNSDAKFILVGDITDTRKDNLSFNHRIFYDRLMNMDIKYLRGNHDIKSSNNSDDTMIYDGYIVMHGNQFNDLFSHPLIFRYISKSRLLTTALLIISRLIRKIFKLRVNYTLEGLDYLIDTFEEVAINYCKHKGYKGIICGHTHRSQDYVSKGIHYLNCGSLTTVIVDNENGLGLINI